MYHVAENFKRTARQCTSALCQLAAVAVGLHTSPFRLEEPEKAGMVMFQGMREQKQPPGSR